MPYKDPEKKKEKMREWRRKVIPAGYGKWLYARRKLRFEDADIFRAQLQEIIEISEHPDHSPEAKLGEINFKAHVCLEESRKREEELGKWEQGGSSE